MKKYFLLFSFLFASLLTFAQNDTQAILYSAYQSTDHEQWKKGISLLEQQYAKSQSDADLLALAKAEYASFGAFMAHGDKKGAEATADKAASHTEDYLSRNKSSAEAHALLSGIYGIQISLSPMKGMTLGTKSSRLIEKALKIDPDNAFANYQRGNSLYFTPKIWGGDVDKAIVHLTKAKALYEKQGTDNEWEYLGALATLGQAYHYKEQLKEAKQTYDIALSTAPDFGWIKYDLLPKLMEDMN
ncbi:MAG: hypothetical protein AAFP19_26780 [Bacteroidota bacterium]